MRAVVFHGIGDIRLDNVPEPKLKKPTDAIVHLTSSAICGTDLHFVRGTFAGMRPGTVLGHEGVGVVQEVGEAVRNFAPGDRVVIPSTIGCGSCSYCRSGYHSQCDSANPNGKDAGTAFYGGPQAAGPFQGLQAEYARIPFAHVNMVKLPQELSDEQAILLSDIFPTGWFGADVAEVKAGDTVAVFGCGPVGIFALVSAALKDAGRLIAVDCVDSRLEVARRHGAEIVNFEKEDPVEAIRELTGGIGPDRVIDAVGIDALRPLRGPAAERAEQRKEQYDREVQHVAPNATAEGDQWVPGNAPSQALRWAVEALAKAGTLSIIGVYPPQAEAFPIGRAMNKNLTVQMGNCNHRRYVPELVRLVRSGAIDPATVLTQQQPLVSAIDAYETFDRREPGWMKVALNPAAAGVAS